MVAAVARPDMDHTCRCLVAAVVLAVDMEAEVVNRRGRRGYFKFLSQDPQKAILTGAARLWLAGT